MKYYKRWNSEGDPFYVDDNGVLVSEDVAKTNLVESYAGRRMTFLESSATDIAAAKKMIGHLVSEGSGEIYRVASADGKSVTLHGPIGKGGTKTISHKSLVSGYSDHGHEDQLDQPTESFREAATDAMESAFRRHAERGHAHVTGKEIDLEKPAARLSPERARMDEAFARWQANQLSR